MFTSNTQKHICLLALIIIYSSPIVTIDAQNIPSCLWNLIPCFAYMNVTKPPVACCKPLNQTISTHLECVCNLYLPSFGVNVTEALTLPARCGIRGYLSVCGGGTESPGSSTTPESDKNGVEKMTESAKVLGLAMFFVAIV